MDNKELLKIIEQAVKDGATTLDVSKKELTALPPEIGKLTNLTSLDLSGNQLTALPPEIGNLTNLIYLNLDSNQLSELPPEIGKLTKLTSLILGNKKLTTLPQKIDKLTKLTTLDLNGNKLTTLPPEIGKLTDLTSLNVSNNQLTALPPEIGNLTNLTSLNLDHNQLAVLPSEIGNLANLTLLDLSNNELSSLPSEIGLLIELKDLVAIFNHLTSLPPQIGKLIKLESLNLSANPLALLPEEIGNLKNLSFLALVDCELSSFPKIILNIQNLKSLDLGDDGGGNLIDILPKEIGRLTNLEQFWLKRNKISSLPTELGNLTKLVGLELEGNPLISPPIEIIKQGTKAVLAFLRELGEGCSQEWLSKMLMVGQGGVGKSALLRALRGEEFIADLSSTYGIEIKSLEFKHPTESNITMQLNAWDFGGQEIYHATHQFFLTNRSLFLLVWNARHGFEQGRLYYWLDAIQALAPDSPILLVATQIDERDADLPLADLRAKYPQIIGLYSVSNKTGQGIEDLRLAITNAATKLPLMGEQWPTAWLNAANAIRAMPEKHITPQNMFGVMSLHSVTDTSQRVLAQWMHELGDILYFADNPELSDLVILKPQWVTEYISKVIVSEKVIDQHGIFTHDHMNELWKDLEPSMREHFLRLMERFDLSYRTLENREVSLVVERLPLEKPDYTTIWDAPKTAEEFHEISLKFKLNTIPAGIPTWFIARAHRFTTHTHWRNGAVFTHEDGRKHLALVQADPHERCLQLSVRGPFPHNFFALLKDGVELILARFPGLQVTRLIPCPGHGGKPCTHEFDYQLLLNRLNKKPMIECPVSLEDVSVPAMLYGWDWNTRDAVLARLDEIEHLQGAALNELKALRALAQREFTNAFRRDQALIESHCPNVFVLRPRDADAKGIRKIATNVKAAIAGKQLDLQLYCQAPGCWHPTEKVGRYQIDEPAKWIRATAPYLQRLLTMLKYVSPVLGPWFNILDKNTFEQVLKADVELLNAIVTQTPDIEYEHPDVELAERIGRIDDPERVEGAALRALRVLLDEKDPKQEWGGLKKILTPEGHYLWLCDVHAEEYKR